MDTTANRMLEYALEYASAGMPIVPLHSAMPDGGCSCMDDRCASPGKHPRTRHGVKDATTDPVTIERWWSKWPKASIGGVGGDFLCLDIDVRSGGFETLSRLIEANAPLPDTATVETGEHGATRGRHHWYRTPPGMSPGTRAGVRPGVDVRCHGGYAVLPPSAHHSGVEYRWMTDARLKDAVEAPAWVADLAPEYVTGDSSWTPDPNFRMSAEVRAFLHGDAAPPVGEQRDFLVRAARSVLTTGETTETTAELLWSGTNDLGGISNCEQDDDDPWTPEEIYSLVSSVYARAPTTKLDKNFAVDQYTLDDVGNAERLMASFPAPERVHHVRETGEWLLWDDEQKHFVRDRYGVWIQRQFVAVTEKMIQLSSSSALSQDDAKRLHAHARYSRKHANVKSAVARASTLASASQSDFDQDPMMFSAANGLVDLRTGVLRECHPHDMVTQRSHVKYIPDARSSVFEDFLERVMPDPELRAFVQRALGYSLTGLAVEHKFFYIYGPPASGKSTLLEVMRSVLGSYATSADPATFMARRMASGSGPTEDLARLATARMVITHEVSEGQRFDEALVSRLVSGDELVARFLHRASFSFHPRFKLWLGANYRARITGAAAQSGIWRRLLVVPMKVEIPPSERDPRLPARLSEPEVLSAVLSWAVRGATAWHDEYHAGRTLTPPESVEEEVTEYKRESDHVLEFVTESLELLDGRVDDEEDAVPKAEMYELYRAWCADNGREHVVTRQKLSRRLKSLGLMDETLWRDGRSVRLWSNARIRGRIVMPQDRR